MKVKDMKDRIRSLERENERLKNRVAQLESELDLWRRL